MRRISLHPLWGLDASWNRRPLPVNPERRLRRRETGEAYMHCDKGVTEMNNIEHLGYGVMMLVALASLLGIARAVFFVVAG
jgi:hypothetical protein